LIISVFICAYLIWQLSAPLTYYFASDEHDERFAWRMFSALGWTQQRCSVSVQEVTMNPLSGELPDQNLEEVLGSWVNMLKGKRSVVVEKFLGSRCKINPWTVRVKMLRACPLPDGTIETLDSVELNCVTGRWVGK